MSLIKDLDNAKKVLALDRNIADKKVEGE